MKSMPVFLCAIALLIICSPAGFTSARDGELRHFPLNSLKEVITSEGITLDSNISSDGKGSLCIKAGKPSVIRLFEVKGLAVDDATLLYEAKVRTHDLKGPAYLEMWCTFPEKGEYFSRGLDKQLTGTTEWTKLSAPFFLKKGEKPILVKLNLVVGGSGTLWIDDIRLVRQPLLKQ
ncbi:MAG: hypothetical protein RDV48_15875 [Candidatus Eremiobacteraeota bacterium]|nr:hypothetical protein [Candidatus Eremiobacteraeota bacterium]